MDPIEGRCRNKMMARVTDLEGWTNTPESNKNSEKDRTLHRRNEIKLREFQILIRGEHNNVTVAHQESRDLKVYIVSADNHLGARFRILFRTLGSHQPKNK